MINSHNQQLYNIIERWYKNHRQAHFTTANINSLDSRQSKVRNIPEAIHKHYEFEMILFFYASFLLRALCDLVAFSRQFKRAVGKDKNKIIRMNLRPLYTCIGFGIR